MNKAELINEITSKSTTPLTKAKAGELIDSVIESIQGALSRGERVTLVGFGTFGVSERSERKGRNPRTGEELMIPSKTVIRFKAGKNLSESVNSIAE